MDERLKFIARLLDGEKMAVLCRQFGISRKTGYKILTRYNLLSGLPKHDFLDFFCQFEILVGDSLGGMILEPDFDPSIRGGKIGVMPSRLGKMADRVDHHQRALPARCLRARPRIQSVS